jgi:hypothetical protein
MTKKAPMEKAPSHTWTSRSTLDGLKTIGPETRDFGPGGQPFPDDVKPAGVCCQLLATVIQIEENTEPRNTMIVEKKCMRAETLSQPKTSTAKNPDSKEEGEDALGGERGAEDVAHESGVVGPIGPELEFHDDAGGHPHREVDGEYFCPKLGHGFVLGIFRFHVHAFHENQERPEPDGQGGEQIMEHDGQSELKARGGGRPWEEDCEKRKGGGQ